MDYGHRESDRRLAELERRIEREYKQAYKEVKVKTDKFFEKFQKTDKEMSEKVKQGIISKQDYIEWRKKAMIKGSSLKNLEKSLAKDLVQADRIATELISGHKVDIYTLNRNYGEYEVENGTNLDLGFSLYNTKATERLIKDQPALLPTQLDEDRDLKWNRQKVSSAITQGILQGESIPNVSKRLQTVVGMDRSAAIRNARTATTGAENAGRVDSYIEAESKGVELEQKWEAVLDLRTRSEHRQLDGQTCPVHGAFEIDGEQIRYPGDPEAPGYLVYNCRCQLVAEIKGIEYKGKRWDRLPEGMSYEQWKNGKQDKAYVAQTVSEANTHGTKILGDAYENHRIENNTISVPLSELDGDFISVDYGKMSIESSNTFNSVFENLTKDYDTPLQQVRTMTKEEFFMNRNSFAYVYHDYTTDSATMIINPTKCKDINALTDRIKDLAENKYCVDIIPGKESEYVATHEFAHTILNMEQKLSEKTNWVKANYDSVKKARKEITPIYEGYMAKVEKLTKEAKDNELKSITANNVDDMQKYGDIAIKAYDELDKVKISDYSLVNIDEFMAEAFTDAKIGKKPKSHSSQCIAVIDKYFRRKK